MIKELVKDLAKYLPAQIAPAIVGLVAIPILTRLFPPRAYGNYVLVMATVSVLGAIVGWLSMSIIRFYPAHERDGRLEELYPTVKIWLLISVSIIAVVFAGTLFFVRNAVEDQLYRLMVIGILVFILTASFQVLQHFLRAKRRAGLYSGFFVWNSVAGLGIGLALVLVFGFGVEGLLWGSILSVALAFPILWRLAIERLPQKSRTSAILTKEMARYSFPLVVGNLAAWILSLSDRYILEFFRGSHEVGIYSASYSISEKSISVIAALFLLAAGPISMIVWEKEGEQKSQDFMSSVTRYYLLLCIPAVVGISILSRPIVDVFTAAEYRGGFRIIPFVALGGLFLGLQQRFQAGFIFYKKTHFIMAAIGGAGLANVGLNLLFVPRYGYMAAAVTTLIGYGILLALMVITSRRYFLWDFPFRSLARAVTASAIMGAAVYPIGNGLSSYQLINLVAAIPLGVAVYFALLLLLGEVKLNEKTVLKQTIARYSPRRLTPASWKRHL
jgi:O-antigen/teichoic acid export membrane protein